MVDMDKIAFIIDIEAKSPELDGKIERIGAWKGLFPL
jgi:hypothetical protein